MENIAKISGGGDEMISAEAVGKIALEKACSMEGLEDAKDIQLDDAEPYELMTIENTTVWAVRFRFNREGYPAEAHFGGMVMVNVFSGEVFRVQLAV